MPDHLIHIGYPKAGSTLLQRWFRDHPRIIYAEAGLAGLSGPEDVALQSLRPTSAADLRVTSAETLATPDALLPRSGPEAEPPIGQDPRRQEHVCRTLAELFPTARILLVTRGFRSALLSGYSEYLRAGGSLGFGEFLARFEAAAAAGRTVLDYDFLIGTYRPAFASGLIVLPFELLRDSADGFFAELERRTGIQSRLVPSGRANPSLSAEELAWYPRLSRFLYRLPFGRKLRRLALGGQEHEQAAAPLRPLVRLLARSDPAVRLTADAIPGEAIAWLRGRASLLKDDPLYGPYADEYLF